MTGEEAKKEIIDMANVLQLIPNTPKGKAVSMALKALEREPVLDKIRAEIAVLDDADYDYEGYYKAVTDALQIIDKYKESEGKE